MTTSRSSILITPQKNRVADTRVMLVQHKPNQLQKGIYILPTSQLSRSTYESYNLSLIYTLNVL